MPDTDVSLITGNLRTLGTTNDNGESASGDAKAVVARDNMTVATHTNAGKAYMRVSKETFKKILTLLE